MWERVKVRWTYILFRFLPDGVWTLDAVPGMSDAKLVVSEPVVRLTPVTYEKSEAYR